MIGKLIVLCSVAAAIQGRPQSDTVSYKPEYVSIDGDVANVNELCPADFRHWLLPHEYDCALFYYCEYGKKWETPRMCAPGTHFSYELQVCIHAEVAGCTLPGSPPPEEVTSTTTDAPITDPQVTDPIVTHPPVTDTPVTEPPVTNATVTEPPVTNATVTEPPVTNATVTETPVTNATVTEPPVTNATVTEPPVTNATVTEPPVTNATVTEPPVTNATVTEPPVTNATVTEPPVTNATVTHPPVTNATVTEPPVTNATVTEPPVTNATLTEPPVTNATVTEPPVTNATVTEPPVTNATVTNPPETDPTEINPTETTESATTTTTPATDPTTEAQVTDPDNEGPWLENGCPADFDVHWLLPHPTKCNKFFYCVFGEKVERTCAPGTVFNPNADPGPVCDWPSNVDCGDKTIEVEESQESTDSDENYEGPWLENGCPSDSNVHWLLPHEDKCNKFYYCVHGEKVERSCPDGTYFNPNAEPGPVCDWPENVDCKNENGGDGNNSNENGNSNSVEDNNSGNNNASSEEVDNGSDNNENSTSVEGSSNEDNGGGNGNGNSTSTEDNNSGNNNASSEEIDNGSNNNETSSSVEDNNGNSNSNEDNNGGNDNGSSESGGNDGDYEGPWFVNGCPVDSDVHWLLPHESECSKFYHCVFGKKVERSCPAGTYFNPNANPGPVCDWPQNVDCANDNSGDNGNGGDNGEGGDDGSGDNGGMDSGSNETSPGEWLENGCPTDFDVHWLLPHESKCNKFYQCNFGEKVERTCAPGTYFNPNAKPGPVCDWPENVDCKNSNENNSAEINSGENSNENGNSTNSSENSSNENATEGPWLENGCPADFDVHWLLPHESKCNKFYYCVFGEKVERSCPDGTYFNPNAVPGPVCDWPQNVDCGHDDGGDNGNGGDNGGDSGSNETGGDNGSNEGDNAGDGGDIGSNENGGDTGSNENGGNGGDNSGEGGDGEDNGGDNGVDSGSNENGGDNDGNGGDNESSETGGDNGSDGGDNESNETGGDNGGNGGENPDHDRCNECNVLPWAHESACDKFWRCEGGKAVLVTCSEGLHFNAKTGLCDFICNANCVRETVEATALEQGLKIFVPWDKVDENLREIYDAEH